MKQSKNLIISADDFGLSPEVTDGILEAHLEGVVTSTTVMANTIDTTRAVALAGENPSLDVGVHLNLTEGTPLSPPETISSLVGADGQFLGVDGYLRRIWRFKIRSSEVELEMSSQVKRLLDLGLAPSHINCHHHAHVYPSSAFAFGRVARRTGIRRVRMNRYCMIGKKAKGFDPGLLKKSASLATKNVYKRLIALLAFRGLVSTDFRISVFLLRRGFDMTDYEQAWIDLIEGLPEGTFEASSHPGRPSDDAGDTIREQRVDELLALKSPRVREALERTGVRLRAFRDLPVLGVAK